MFDLVKFIKSALGKGTRTSEFYLAIIAMFIPLLDGLIDRIIHWITNAQTTAHNPAYMIALAAAAAAVSAAYSLARAMIKREHIRQIPTVMALDPNTVTPGLGTPEAERAHAIAAGARASDLAPLPSADPNDRAL